MIHMQLPSIVKPILVLAGAAVLLTVMHFAASFLVPVFLAIFFAALLTPIYSWLKKQRMPKGLALLLSIGLLALIALFLVLLVGRSTTVLENSLDSYRDQFSQRQAELAAQLEGLSPSIDLTPLLSAINPDALVNSLSYVLSTVAGIFKDGFLILILTMFLLVEAPLFKARMSQAFGADHSMTQNVIALARIMVRDTTHPAGLCAGRPGAGDHHRFPCSCHQRYFRECPSTDGDGRKPVGLPHGSISFSYVLGVHPGWTWRLPRHAADHGGDLIPV
jgi:AI-2E family transporter